MPSGWRLTCCAGRRRDPAGDNSQHPTSNFQGPREARQSLPVAWASGVGGWALSMTTRSVAVVNRLGMHARAAARCVHLATRFESHIRVGRDSKVMDGKSIMGILLLAASRGTTMTI